MKSTNYFGKNEIHSEYLVYMLLEDFLLQTKTHPNFDLGGFYIN